MTAKTTLVFTGSTSHYAIINPVERFPGATMRGSMLRFPAVRLTDRPPG